MITESRESYAAMLAAEQAAELDDILSRWHQWQQSTRVGRGFNNRALVVGDFRVSRQYDDANGALDDDLDNARMKQVEFEVGEMVDPYRAAIYCLARALSVGVAVFMSPRLPADRAARDVIVASARGILIARLVSAGVM